MSSHTTLSKIGLLWTTLSAVFYTSSANSTITNNTATNALINQNPYLTENFSFPSLSPIDPICPIPLENNPSLDKELFETLSNTKAFSDNFFENDKTSSTPCILHTTYEEHWKALMISFETELENYREIAYSLPDKKLRQAFILLSKALHDLKEEIPCDENLSKNPTFPLWQQKFEKQKTHFESLKQKVQQEKENLENLVITSPSGKNLKLLVSEDLQIKSPLSVNDEILLHVLGDRFGHKSGKEGHSENVSLDYFEAFLSTQEHLSSTHFPNKILKEKYAIAKKLWQFAHPSIDFSLEEKALQNRFDETATQFSKALRKECEVLEIGDSIFFPGGWSKKGGGHATIYEVIRESKTFFRFRIINTGDGLATYHSFKIKNHDKLYLPFLDITHVSLEDLTSTHLTRAMIEMQTAFNLPSNPDEETQWKAEDIYMRMLSALRGQIAIPNNDEDDWMNPQFAGTCSFRGKMALARRHMPPKQYLRFEFEFSAWTLKQYLIENKKALDEEVKRNLLRKSTQVFSRLVLNYFDEKIISKEELAISHKLIQEALSEINQAEQELMTKLDQEAPLTDMDAPLAKTSIATRGVIEALDSTFIASENNEIPIEPYHSLDLINWRPDPVEFVSDLQNFKTLCTQAYADQNYQTITDFVAALYQKIPLTDIEEGSEMWAKIDIEEKKEIIHTLSEISELFFKSSFHIPENIQANNPERFMTLLRATTLSYQLTKELPKDLGIPDALHPFTNNFFKNTRDSAYFLTYDPELDRQFSKIHAMLHKMKVPLIHHQQAKQISSSSLTIPKDWNPDRVPTEIGEQELQFVATLIKRPDIKAKLKKKYSNYEGLSFVEKVLTAYADPDETFFPPLFYALRKQNFYMNYFFQGILGTPPGFKITDDFCQLKYRWRLSNGQYNIDTNLEGINRHVLNAYPEFEGKKEGHQFEFTQRQIKNPALQAIITKPRIDDNEAVLLQESKGNLPLKNYKELHLLRSKSSLQLTRSLSYFQRNYELLTQTDYQTFLNFLIFEPGLLHEQLSQPVERELFTRQLSEFIHKGFSHFYDRNDIDSCIYFLQLNRRLKAYVATYQKKSFSPSSPLFYATRQKLQELLQQKSLSESTKTLIHREIAASFIHETHLSSMEELTTLLTSASYFHAHFIDKDKEDPQVHQEVRRVLYKFRQDIQKRLASRENDAIFHHIQHTLQPNAAKGAWEVSSYPLFISKEQELAFNVLEGKFYSQKRLLTNSPRSLLESAEYRDIFGTRLYEYVSPEPNIIEFQDENFRKYRIITQKDQKIFQTESKQGKWVQYVPRSTFIAHKKNERFPHSKIRTLGLVHDHLHWVTQEGKVLIMDKARQQFSHEVSFSPSSIPSNPDTVTIKTLTSKKPTPSFFSNISPQIFSSAPETAELQLYLPYETPFSFLEFFESPEYIHLWKNAQTDKIEKIELPRFKELTFKAAKVNGELRAQWTHLPTYYIAKKQHVPALGDYRRFILLEDQTGKKKKVIVPFQEAYSDRGKRSLDTNYELNQLIKQEHLEPQSYVTYDLNEKGELQAKDLKGHFYLAYISLFKQDYNKADQILRDYGSNFDPYTEEEVEVLNQILKLEEITHDHDPQNIALTLYVYYLSLQNHDKGEVITFKPDNDKILDLFNIYLNQLEDTTRFQLKAEEEMLLIEHLTTNCDTTPMRLVNRLTALDPVRGKRLIAECAIKSTYTPRYFSSNFVSNVDARAIHHAYNNPSTYNNDGKAILKKETGLKMRLNEPWFLLNFPSYYEKAKKATTATSKNQLEYELSLYHYPNNNDITEQIRSILLMVLRHPEAFPDAKTMKSYLERENSEEDFNTAVLEPYRHLLQEKNPYYFSENHNIERLTAIQEKPENPTSYSAPFLSHISFKTSPIQADLSHILTPLPPKPSYLSQFEKTKKELPAIFDHKASQPFIQKQLTALKEDCEIFLQNPPKTKFALQPNANLETLQKTLKQEINTKEAIANEMHLNMLSLANILPQEPTAYDIISLQTQATYRRPLLEDDLILLFLRKDSSLYKQANPALSDVQIAKLHEILGNYLVQMSSLQHLKRLSFRLNQIEQTLEKGEDADLLIQAYAKEAKAERNYEVNEHPEYLVFEYYADLLMYPFQVEKLDELLEAIAQNDRERIGIILEMIMGSGKSKVLLPLLGLMNADGAHLSMIIMPEDLIHSIGSELQETFRHAFDQTVDQLQFERNTLLSLRDLRRIHTKLEMIQKNKKVLLMTSKSLQSLYLKYLETFYWYKYASEAKEKAAWKDQLHEMRKIISRLKTKGLPIFDEADLLFNCRHEVHFTMGDGEKIKEAHLDLVKELYYILIHENTAKFDFTCEASDKTFTPATYQEEIRPIIAKKLIQRFETQSFGLDNTVNHYFQNLAAQDREKIFHYLLNDHHISGVQAFINAIPNRQIQNLLALAKEEINTIFALTANRNINEHYGFSPDLAAYPLAIPYHKGEPIRGSQFGNPYEVINYSMQLYYKEGIPPKILFEKILLLRNQALNELRINPSLNLEDTQAYAKYQTFHPSASPESLFRLTENDAKKIAQTLNTHPDKKLDFIRQYILSDVEIYPQRLSSNPQVFGRILDKMFGFTGTLWNDETFPVGLEGREAKGTTGKTLTLLWMKSPEKIRIIPDNNLLESIGSLFKEQEHALVLIDAGGLLRGLESEMIAKACLTQASKRNPSIDHGLYFDKEGYLKTISTTNQEKAPQPFSSATSNPKTRISIYDQKHTTGANIKQDEKALAFVSVGRHTLLRDLLQAVWRMRGLGRDQSITFFMTEEDRKFLIKLLGKGADHEPTLQDILLFVAHNQIHKKGEDNYLNLKQKMKAVFEKALFELLLDETLSFEEMELFSNEIEALFFSNLEDTPFLQYGQMQTMMPTQQVIKQDLQTSLSKNLNSLQSNPLLASKLNLNALESEMHRLVDYAHLPSTLPGSQDATLETQIEVMTKQKTKIQQKVVKKVEQRNFPPLSPWTWNFVNGATFLEDLTQFKALEDLEKIDSGADYRYDSYRIKYYFPKKSKNTSPPIFSLADCLSTNALLKETSKAFDPSIGATFNFMPLKRSKPFGRFQKTAEEVLIVKPPNDTFKVLLLDQYDADFFKKTFMKNNLLFPKGTQLGIYNLHIGLIQGQSEYTLDSSWEQDPSLQKLLVQAKFFNGELFYSSEEALLLKEWLQTNNPKAMLDLFYGEILKWRPHDQNRFYDSTLHQIFKGLSSNVKEKAEAFTSILHEKRQQRVESSQKIQEEPIKKTKRQDLSEYEYQSLAVTPKNHEDWQKILSRLRLKLKDTSLSRQIKYKYKKLLGKNLKNYPPFYFKEASYIKHLNYLRETLTLSNNISIIFDYMEAIANEVKGHSSLARQLASDLDKDLQFFSDESVSDDYKQMALNDLLTSILTENMPCFSENYEENFKYALLGLQHIDSIKDPYFTQIVDQIPNESIATQFAEDLLQKFTDHNFEIDYKFSTIFKALVAKYPSLEIYLKQQHFDHINLDSFFESL